MLIEIKGNKITIQNFIPLKIEDEIKLVHLYEQISQIHL